jgi:hypothetical protein
MLGLTPCTLLRPLKLTPAATGAGSQQARRLKEGENTMSRETLKRLMAPAFFLLVFLFPASYVDEALLQVSSTLLQRMIWNCH